jgi:hypothetical protein
MLHWTSFLIEEGAKSKITEGEKVGTGLLHWFLSKGACNRWLYNGLSFFGVSRRRRFSFQH